MIVSWSIKPLVDEDVSIMRPRPDCGEAWTCNLSFRDRRLERL